MRRAKSRKATLSDLIITYIIITVLAVAFYLYFVYYNEYLSPRPPIKRSRSYEVSVKYRPDKLLNVKQGQSIFKKDLSATPHAENLPPSTPTSEVILIESYLGGKGRQLFCMDCFKSQIKFVLSSTACTSEGDIDVLFIIFSVPEDMKRRDTLRQSWLSPYRNNTQRVRYVFVLGLSEYFENDAKIQQENKAQMDIIQGNFLEDLHNITYKMLTGLQWGVMHCAKAKYIAKIKDDTWVNIRHLLATLKQVSSRTLIGNCVFESMPDRNYSSQRYASVLSYPLPVFPPYCTGPGYVTLMNTAAAVLKISPDIPCFHLEDVYLGMCMAHLNMTVRHVHGFVTAEERTGLCSYRGREVIFAHGLSIGAIRSLWLSRC